MPQFRVHESSRPGTLGERALSDLQTWLQGCKSSEMVAWTYLGPEMSSMQVMRYF